MTVSFHFKKISGPVLVALVAVAQNHEVSGFAPQRAAIHYPPSSLRKGDGKPTVIRQLSLDNTWAEFSKSLPPLPSQLGLTTEQIANVLSASLQEEEFLSKAVENTFLSLVSAFLSLPYTSEIAVFVVPVITLTGIVLYNLSFPKDDFREGYEPYRRGEYDPLEARVYYSKHKMLVIQRSLQLLRISNKFI